MIVTQDHFYRIKATEHHAVPCRTEYATLQSIPLFQECSYVEMREIEQFNMKVSGFGTPRWRSAAGISQNVATAPFNLGGRRQYHNYQQHEHAITILFSLDIITMVILIEYKGHPMEMTFHHQDAWVWDLLAPDCFPVGQIQRIGNTTQTKHNTTQHRPSTTHHNTNQTQHNTTQTKLNKTQTKF